MERENNREERGEAAALGLLGVCWELGAVLGAGGTAQYGVQERVMASCSARPGTEILRSRAERPDSVFRCLCCNLYFYNDTVTVTLIFHFFFSYRKEFNGH